MTLSNSWLKGLLFEIQNDVHAKEEFFLHFLHILSVKYNEGFAFFKKSSSVLVQTT